MKELAAFANSEGGTLIIGIDDEKNILGLANDFEKLGKTDKQDAFKLKFDDIVRDYLGDSAFDLFTAEFVNIDDKLVFVVDVRSSASKIDPVWLNKNEKGNLESLLYIRAESSARNLGGKDLANYIRRK